MIKEFPGVRQMLASLKNSDCRIAIVSSKGRGGIERGLDYFKLQDYIDVIVSAYDVQKGKPHPEPVLKALELLEGQAEDTLMVGDSPYDILCGKNAGIKTVLVEWTIFPREEVIKFNPDFIIKTPWDLIKIIKNSQAAG